MPNNPIDYLSDLVVSSVQESTGQIGKFRAKNMRRKAAAMGVDIPDPSGMTFQELQFLMSLPEVKAQRQLAEESVSPEARALGSQETQAKIEDITSQSKQREAAAALSSRLAGVQDDKEFAQMFKEYTDNINAMTRMGAVMGKLGELPTPENKKILDQMDDQFQRIKELHESLSVKLNTKSGIKKESVGKKSSKAKPVKNEFKVRFLIDVGTDVAGSEIKAGSIGTLHSNEEFKELLEKGMVEEIK